MFITLKTVLRTLILPPAGPLLLAALGAWLAARGAGRARHAGWILLTLCLAFLWLIATPIVADGLTRLSVRYPALDPARVAGAQAVVVLGGASARDGAPEYGGEPAIADELLERISYAAYLARRTQLPVLISGAPDETRAMQRTLARAFGIEPRWIEGRSRDTFQNAEFSARILRAAGVSHILLVTSARHEWRAAHEFASAGLAVEPAPVGLPVHGRRTITTYLPEVRALGRSSGALYELVADLARQTFAALGLRRHSA